MLFFSSNFTITIEDPDQTPHYAVSDLDLHCLPMSHEKDARLILWVDSVILIKRSYIMMIMHLFKRTHKQLYFWRNQKLKALYLGFTEIFFTLRRHISGNNSHENTFQWANLNTKLKILLPFSYIKLLIMILGKKRLYPYSH